MFRLELSVQMAAFVELYFIFRKCNQYMAGGATLGQVMVPLVMS